MNHSAEKYLDSLAKSVIWQCGGYSAENIDLYCDDRQKFELISLLVNPADPKHICNLNLLVGTGNLKDIIKQKLTEFKQEKLDGCKTNCI